MTMDAEWLATLGARRTTCFPRAGPLVTWVVNLGYVPIIAGIYRYRRAHGRCVPRETALVAGCLSLVLVFLALLPFNLARVALAIQLQPARDSSGCWIFWR